MEMILYLLVFNDCLTNTTFATHAVSKTTYKNENLKSVCVYKNLCWETVCRGFEILNYVFIYNNDRVYFNHNVLVYICVPCIFKIHTYYAYTHTPTLYSLELKLCECYYVSIPHLLVRRQFRYWISWCCCCWAWPRWRSCWTF